MNSRLLLHERTGTDGALERTWLEVEGGTMFLCADGEPRTALPVAFLDGIMQRYGKPLDEGVVLDGPRLEVGERKLCMLRYRPRYDVISKDYFVYEIGEEPPVVELATAVTAALEYLLRRR